MNTSLTKIYLAGNKIGDEGERQSRGIESRIPVAEIFISESYW